MRRAFASGTFALLMLAAGPAVSQREVQRIAVLSPTTGPWLAIRKVLAAQGLVEGQNLVSDVRVGTPDQLPTLARDIVTARPNVIIAVSSALGAVTAATADIPVVGFGPDPVEQGFAESHARPGGNVTGVAIFAALLDGKRLELLAEGTPGQRIAVLLNPVAPSSTQSRQAVETVARRLGHEPMLFDARGPEDYPAVFEGMRVAGVKSLVISANSWFFRDRELLGELARGAGIVTMCEWGDMAQSACTMGYGPVRSDVYARAADQVARILRGSHPREIPIEQPSRFELVINAIAAKSLGTTIPTTLLARADEVIE